MSASNKGVVGVEVSDLVEVREDERCESSDSNGEKDVTKIISSFRSSLRNSISNTMKANKPPEVIQLFTIQWYFQILY